MICDNYPGTGSGAFLGGFQAISAWHSGRLNRSLDGGLLASKLVTQILK